MFNHFIAGQRIRAGISDRTSQDKGIPKKLREVFIKVFNNDSRGTLLNDMWSFHEESQYTLPKSATKSFLIADIYHLLQDRLPTPVFPCPVFVRPNFIHKGVTFSTYMDSPGNSNIIFSYSTGWSAGRIIAIFLWPSGSENESALMPCCVVEPMHQLTDVDASSDPYRAFPDMLAGRLFYSSYGSPIILLVDDIICHFADTRFRSGNSEVAITHVLPLDRVRARQIMLVTSLTDEHRINTIYRSALGGERSQNRGVYGLKALACLPDVLVQASNSIWQYPRRLTFVCDDKNAVRTYAWKVGNFPFPDDAPPRLWLNRNAPPNLVQIWSVRMDE